MTSAHAELERHSQLGLRTSAVVCSWSVPLVWLTLAQWILSVWAQLFLLCGRSHLAPWLAARGLVGDSALVRVSSRRAFWMGPCTGSWDSRGI